MNNFSRNEKVDMLLIYGECHKNSTAAAGLYQQRYPNRRPPSRHLFARVEQKLRNEPDQQDDHQTFIVSEDKEIDVLGFVMVHPTTSTRELSTECDISQSSVCRILKKHKFRSYKYQIHQHLYGDDNDRRLVYCNWFLNAVQQNPGFPFHILYSDESRFTNQGMFNRNNTRYWAQENPRLVGRGNIQERFGFNCWLGVLGDRIIGPIFFDGTLTGERYLFFLQNQTAEFLDLLPLAYLQNLFFQQDGAPPHNSRRVMEYLNNLYGERLIANQGHIRWPPRSPDLTPLDYYVWGTLKNKVYKTSSNTREELQNKVVRALNEITPAELRRAIQATVRRAELCIEKNGGHFEQYL